LKRKAFLELMARSIGNRFLTFFPIEGSRNYKES
jgi:hypothetical protein